VTLDRHDDVQINSEPGVSNGGPHGRVGVHARDGAPDQGAVSVLAERAAEIVRYAREGALQVGAGLRELPILHRSAPEQLAGQ
jgi:hypothetical protein